jgi:hypothetical protein
LQFRDVGNESHGANSGNAGDDGGTLDRGKKGDNAGYGMATSKPHGPLQGRLRKHPMAIAPQLCDNARAHKCCQIED